MDCEDQLRLLAEGINPITEEALCETSITRHLNVRSILAALAAEMSVLKVNAARERNIAAGRPARSHFFWSDTERTQLIQAHREGTSVESMSEYFERTQLAIIMQLHKLDEITEVQLHSLKQLLRLS